jgi:hypothetical protein
MQKTWSTALTPSWRPLAAFLGAWLGLSLCPFLPAWGASKAVSPFFPLSVEVLVLVTLVVYTSGTRWAHVGRVIAGGGFAALLVYQTYDAVVYAAFRRSGIWAEDAQYVVDLAYLAADVVSWQTAPWIVLGTAAVAALAWGVPRLLRTIAHCGRHGGCRGALVAGHLVLWPLVLVVAPAQEWGTEALAYQTSNERVRPRTVATKLVQNARASVRLRTLLDTLGTAPVDSSYSSYERLPLQQRPNVFLLMIESYGEVLDRHPDLRAPYRSMMQRVKASLAADGWHAATAVSDAPVRGGRSWLAIASAFLGTRVDHQLLYERFQSGGSSVPHLVDVFDAQGYRTVTLQPYMMARPGLPLGNPYGFDVTLYRKDLPYEGPPYGWGLVDVPDQYSLGYAHAQHIAESPEPTFLFFETALSHALWNYGLPPVLEDWRAFDTPGRSPHVRRTALSDRADPPPLLPDSLTAPRIFDQPTPIRFLRHIGYEMQVLRQYLQTSVPPNSLVILMGDHQPPLLDTETFGVPVHVLSRDPSLVAPFRAQGFTDGLSLAATSPRLKHESLYSRIVRALAASDSSATAGPSPPPLKPNGVPRSILVSPQMPATQQ